MAGGRGEDMYTPVSDEERRRLGRRAREAREYLGLAPEFVAERLGMSRTALLALEAGRRQVSADELEQLAGLLKRPVEAFLSDGDAEAGREQDATVQAAFRTAHSLIAGDRQQVLRFGEFLRAAGPAPVPPDETTGT